MVTTMSSTRNSSSTWIDGTPATGLSCYVAAEHSAFTAPGSRVQGTAVPFAGTSAAAAAAPAQVALAGVRVIDLPGSPPRGAPV